MWSCSEVISKVSVSSGRNLNFREWLGVRLHLYRCETCRPMQRQLHLLRTLSRRYMSDKKALNQSNIFDAARRRILLRLRSASHNHKHRGGK